MRVYLMGELLICGVVVYMMTIVVKAMEIVSEVLNCVVSDFEWCYDRTEKICFSCKKILDLSYLENLTVKFVIICIYFICDHIKS